MTTLLQIDGVTKRFGPVIAVDRISLEVKDGEFFAILGPSGCGKTTLLRAIAGLDRQSSGSITQAGREISNLPPAQRDFGIVFQSYALFPNLTVDSNVAYGLRGMDGAAKKKRVKELLSLIGLPDSGNKYPAQLSGGQQQRIALARALAPSPGLLLLDEPLSALDARVRIHLRREIRELQRRLNVTTIMVTHDQEEALTMADRIVVMNHGVIDQVGTPQEIYQKPASAFVADFVGTMNFLSGEVIAPGQVRFGRATLACPGATGAPGSKVRLSLRPEDVRVRDINDAVANRIEVTVKTIEFLGSFSRASLLANGDVEPIIADFSVNLMRDLQVAVGRRMTIALPPDRLIAFAG